MYFPFMIDLITISPEAVNGRWATSQKAKASGEWVALTFGYATLDADYKVYRNYVSAGYATIFQVRDTTASVKRCLSLQLMSSDGSQLLQVVNFLVLNVSGQKKYYICAESTRPHRNRQPAWKWCVEPDVLYL